MSWLAVAVGGAVGSVARYAVGMAIAPRGFPWATLGINVSGSFVLGFLLAGPMADRASSPLVVGITIGFLGAYTTFSTFGYETVMLIQQDRAAAAAAYALASVIVGLGAAGLGYWSGKVIAG